MQAKDKLKPRIEEHKPGCEDQWLTVIPVIKKDVGVLRRENSLGELIDDISNFRRSPQEVSC